MDGCDNLWSLDDVWISMYMNNNMYTCCDVVKAFDEVCCLSEKFLTYSSSEYPSPVCEPSEVFVGQYCSISNSFKKEFRMDSDISQLKTFKGGNEESQTKCFE